MADNKLQELIETLKKEAIESGEASSRRIIEQAREEASRIVEKARAEAEEIVRQAREEAARSQQQLASSMEIAGSQFVTNLKRVIEENLLVLPFKEKITEALGDTTFLKELIKTVVAEYARDPQKDELQLLVPKDQQERLVDFVVELIREKAEAADPNRPALTLHTGNVDFGFVINNTKGNVALDFTDEAFLALFLRFLSPRFREFFKEVKVGELAETEK